MNWKRSRTSVLTTSTGLFRLRKKEFVQRKHLSEKRFFCDVFNRTTDLTVSSGARRQFRPGYSVGVYPTHNFLGKFWEKCPFKKYSGLLPLVSLPHRPSSQVRENFPVDLIAPAGGISSPGNFNEIQHHMAQRGFRLDLALQLGGFWLNEVLESPFGNGGDPENEEM